VTGSEKNMKIEIMPSGLVTSSSWANEFGEPTEARSTGTRVCGHTMYLLVLEGNLRDRTYTETFQEFNKWLNRLAKRIYVNDILVRIEGQWIEGKYEWKTHTYSDPKPYQGMEEPPSWSDDTEGEPAWWEYLMWEPAPHYRYPLLLAHKYYNNKEIDEEMERRESFSKSKITAL
jgi:hypothetical protein